MKLSQNLYAETLLQSIGGPGQVRSILEGWGLEPEDLVAVTIELPDPVRVLSATVRAGAFIGMGVAAVRRSGPGATSGVRHP